MQASSLQSTFFFELLNDAHYKPAMIAIKAVP